LDPRIVTVGRLARDLGMIPYEHSNGDVLRKNPRLLDEALEVFERIVIGLYDHETAEEREVEKQFWVTRMGPKVEFSSVDHVYPRSHYTDRNLAGFEARRGRRPRVKTHPDAHCHAPVAKCIVHYTGRLALCCEDMTESFDFGSAFDRTLRDLWYSPGHIEVVKHLRTGPRSRYPLCARCPIPPYEYGWTAWERAKSN
jgi:hypothetical protein